MQLICFIGPCCFFVTKDNLSKVKQKATLINQRMNAQILRNIGISADQFKHSDENSKIYGIWHYPMVYTPDIEYSREGVVNILRSYCHLDKLDFLDDGTPTILI